MLKTWYKTLLTFLEFPSVSPAQLLTINVICFMAIDITSKRQIYSQRTEFVAMADNANNMGLNTKRQKKALLLK